MAHKSNPVDIFNFLFLNINMNITRETYHNQVPIANWTVYHIHYVHYVCKVSNFWFMLFYHLFAKLNVLNPLLACFKKHRNLVPG